MKFLDDEKLNEVIDEYINKENSLALCINGVWGIGKTYFIKKYIEKRLEENNKVTIKDENKRIYFRKRKKEEKIEDKKDIHYLYVSLYGVKTKEDLYQKIITYRLKNYGRFGGLLSFAYKNISVFETIIKSIIPEEKTKEMMKDIKVSDFLMNISSLEGDVIFFDEVERCQMDIMDLMGVIYDYIETEKAKCILIVNEDELLKNKELDAEEYKRKKEKVVELTVKYHNNLNNIINELLENEDEEIRELICKNIDIIIECMEYYNHTNIRTIKYAVYVIQNVIKDININLNEKDNINLKRLKENIIIFVFISSIAYKMGIKINRIFEDDFIKQIDIEKYMFKNGYKCIEDYIQTGFLNKDELNVWVCKYLMDKNKENINKNDVIDKIVYYWQNDEHDVEDALKKLLLLIKKEEYEIEKYPEMIAVLMKLNEIKFENNKVIEAIYEEMKENLKKGKNVSINFRDTFLFDIQDFSKEQYLEKISEFEKIFVNSKNKIFIEEINNTLGSDEWGEKIYKLRVAYLTDNKLSTGYLNIFDMNKLKRALKIGKVRDISNFRRDINTYYERLAKEILIFDLDSFKELDDYIMKELLVEHVPSIRKLNYTRLHEILQKNIEKLEDNKKDEE